MTRVEQARASREAQIQAFARSFKLLAILAPLKPINVLIVPRKKQARPAKHVHH